MHRLFFYIFQISKPKRFFTTVGLELTTFCSLGKQAILPRRVERGQLLTHGFDLQSSAMHISFIHNPGWFCG